MDRSGPTPAIRLYLVDSAGGGVEEERLPVPEAIGIHARDTSLPTAIEPAALVWHAAKLYVGDFETGLVYEYTRGAGGSWRGAVFAGRVEGGRPLRGYAVGDRSTAKFGGITGMTWHGDALYVADPDNHVVRKIGPDGAVEVVAGTPGEPGSSGDGADPREARLHYPKAVAFDTAGRLFIADGDNHRIRVVEAGRIRTLVGGDTPEFKDGDARRVTVGQIVNLTFDGAGNLLFTDGATSRIRKLWLGFGL